MSAGELKNRERPGLSVDKKLMDRLRKLSEETLIPMSKLVDKAIENLLREYESKVGGE